MGLYGRGHLSGDGDPFVHIPIVLLGLLHAPHELDWDWYLSQLLLEELGFAR